MVENYSDYKELLDTLKQTTLINFAIENKLDMKIDKQIENFTIEEFCKEYIDSDTCYSKNNLEILNEISNYIQSIIRLNVFIDLDGISFDHLKQYIKSSKF